MLPVKNKKIGYCQLYDFVWKSCAACWWWLFQNPDVEFSMVFTCSQYGFHLFAR